MHNSRPILNYVVEYLLKQYDDADDVKVFLLT